MICNYSDVMDRVVCLKNKYMTCDPFELCESLDIPVLKHNLGEDRKAIKGLCMFVEGSGVIVLNSDLPEHIQKVVVAHELGHAVLHNDMAVHTFSDLDLYSQNVITEKEANFFAAELLIEDDEIMNALNEGYSIFETAAKLDVPVEIIDYKFKLLSQKGYKITYIPLCDSKSDFLGRIPLNNNIEFSEGC